MSTYRRALLLAAATTVATATTVAQTRPPHRIEITRTPPRAHIPRTAAEPRLRTTAGAMGVVDWMGQTGAPSTLSGGRAPVTILADDVTFKGRTYVLRGTPRLTIVARTLEITGRVTFDLSAKDPGDSGGAVSILAGAVRCAPGARLTITSNGGNSTAPGVPGTNGGTLTIAADTFGTESHAVAASPAAARPSAAQPSPAAGPLAWNAQRRGEPSTTQQNVECIAFSSTGGRGTGRNVTFTDRGGHRRTRHDPPTPGRPGGFEHRKSRAAAVAKHEDLRLPLSQWSLATLQRLRAAILDADAAEDYPALVQLFARYASLTPTVDLHPKVRADYDNLRAELNRYRGDVLLPLFARPIDVAPAGGLTQPIWVFTESSPFRHTLGPTHMLASPIEVDGRTVLGALEYDPSRPDELNVEVELELSLDPWLAALAAAKLRQGGTDATGMFSGWTLKARPIEDIGVKDSRVTIVPGGRRLRVRLVLEGQKAATLFWNLFSGVGIPLTYDWEYRGSNQTVTAGTWTGPTLSFARRVAHTVRVENGQVRNVGQAPVVIEYVGLGDAEFVGLPRAVRIEAGQAVDLKNLGVAAPAPKLWIPPQAVVTALDPRDVERAFYVLNGQQFVEHVTLTNLLPGHDAASGGALQYVELFVAVGVRESRGTSATQAGPFRLSAANTTGSEIRLPFLRPGKNAERLTVWGTAYYENGGCQTIADTTFDSWVVKITPSMLVRNRPPVPGAAAPIPCGKGN